jgi:Tol biopolymer transport system component
MGPAAGVAVCGTAVAVLLGFTTSSARPAPATYPGANGKIVLVRKTPPCSGGDSPICKLTVWAMSPDGSGLRRLTKGPCDSVPTWSGDGRRIAYVHVEGRGCTRHAIWVMGANGSGKHRVGFVNMTFGLESLSWSPDGREILYAGVQTRRQGSSIVFVRYAVSSLNVATGKIRTVFGGRHSQSDVIAGARWSPDGRRIAYIGQRGNVGVLIVARPNGFGKRVVLKAPLGSLEQFDWSPDSRRIVFAPAGSADLPLEVVNADGTGRHAVTRVYGSKGHPVWSPDGRSIVFELEAGGNDPMKERFAVIRADGTGLARIGPGAKGCQIRVGGGTEPCPAREPSWASR